MVLNTSYNDPKVREEIDQSLGKSFTFIQRIMKSGIGSQRMLVAQVSAELMHCINADHYPTYSSIELRPKGILVHFNKNTITHAWPIPYFALAIYQSDGFSLHSRGQFVKYRDTDAADHKFFRKLMDEKIGWEAEHASPFPPI